MVKPPAGAGAKSTFRLDDPDRPHRVAGGRPAHRPARADRGVPDRRGGLLRQRDGRRGDRCWDSISNYLPTPLEVLRNPWMQWVVLLPRDISGPEYVGIRQVAPVALRALGLTTGLTHMEWFRRPDGSVAVSEVGARPPGAQITSMLCYAHDFDLYRAWAQLMVHGTFEPPARQWSAGTVYLRGQGAGRVRWGSRPTAEGKAVWFDAAQRPALAVPAGARSATYTNGNDHIKSRIKPSDDDRSQPVLTRHA